MDYFTLILNVSLMVALSVVSSFIEQYWPRHTSTGKVIQGLAFGAVAALSMFHSLQLEPGLLFDGRSIMLSLCALFFGPLSAVISSVLALICRLALGGSGVVLGCILIASSTTIGLVAHRLFRVNGRTLLLRHLFVFGIVVHIVMLAAAFSLPLETALATVKSIGLPVLLFYPLATVLVGKILLDQERNLQFIERLQQAKEQLDITLRSIQDAVIATDTNGTILYMNPVAETLTGWRLDEARAKSLAEVMHLIDKESGKPLINPAHQVLTNGEPVQRKNTTTLIGRDGSERRISENAAPMHDAAGNLTGVVLIFCDVTLELATREQLRRSESLFRNLFEHHAAVKLLIDPGDGAILEANQAAETFYGWPRAQLKAMRIQDINSLPEEELQSKIVQASSNKNIHFEFRHRSANGQLRDVEVFSSPIVVQGRSLLHSIVHDVTAKKTAERELLSSKEYLNSVLRAAPVGIGVVVNRVVTTANDQLCAMTGYSRDELLGQNIRLLYSSDQEYAHVGAEKYLQIRQRNFGTVETTWHRKDGQIIDVLLSFSPLDANDLSAGVTLSALDISARKRAEREREQLQNQLIQVRKMESVGRLTGGVAHDFNNILAVILGYTELTLESTPTESPLYGNLQRIKEAGNRSAEIVRQLLAFSRQQTIAPKVLDLNATVGEMIKMLQRLIGENINLAWIPATTLPSVLIDPAQIDQVLINLCINARDAINGIGRLTIETGTAAMDHHYCQQHAGFVPGDYVVLSVSDTGCGMTPEIMEKVFEPFFTTKKLGEGTGLGLSTVYGIVKQNLGFINVYSEPGQGTTFRIYFPQHAEQKGHIRQGRSTRTDQGMGETILLVEDDPVLLDMSRTMLERLGYEVLAASSPLKALHSTENKTQYIDLLLTDVIMPEMNGRELASQLTQRNPELRVLYMSGYTANVIAHHGVLDAGIHFLGKPFSSQELSNKIREALA